MKRQILPWKIKVAFAMLIVFIFSIFVYAQESPRNIEGRVFTENDKLKGVEGGNIVVINNTVNGDLTIVYTEDPGPDELKGIYSGTITGSDNNLIIVTSWNSTHFGRANATLLPTTTTIDVVYNYTRYSETNVTIISPLNNSIFNITYAFNVTANISVIGANGSFCNASINFTESVADITQDQNYTNLLGNISAGNYSLTTWNVTGLLPIPGNVTVSARCKSDGVILENVNSYSIRLSFVDQILPGSSSLETNDSSVEQFEFVKFNATWTDNVNLSSFRFSTNSSGSWINFTNISFQGPQNVSNFSMQINASPGFVVGWMFHANDTYGNINSSSVSSFVVVPQYHIFYGDVFENIILGTFENLSIIEWINPTKIAGNVYVTDSDTQNGITWTSLFAIGKDTSLNSNSNDWGDIDSLLGTAGYNDSINRSWTSNSAPKNMSDFVVLGSSIINVSTINSTNTSNFVTGILWDASDSVNAQFDTSDAEDIVFVTKVESTRLGKFGTYNYEIKIPAKLRRYRSQNNDDSVSFYSELT